MLRLAGGADPAVYDDPGSIRERTAQALKDTHLCSLSRESFLELQRQYPKQFEKVVRVAK